MKFLNLVVPLFFFILIGLLCVLITFDKKNEKKYAIKIYFTSLFTYLIYAVIAYLAYLNNDGFFHYPDQDGFFSISQQLGKMQNVSAIFKACFIDRIHIENEGAYFYLGILSYFANNFLAGNSVFFQIINVSFIASLVQLFTFKILLDFVPLKLAFKYALIYIFASYVFYYSPWLLRDLHITLFYAIGLSILFSPFSINKLLTLILLMFITSQFRFEHGVFFAFIPLLYIYEQTKGKKITRYFLIFLFGVIIVYSSSLILKNFDNIFSTLERYNEFTSNSAMEQGGLGNKLLLLPNGIKQLASVIYSQFSPFPSWNLVINGTDIYQIIIGLVKMISPLFWFIIWFSVIISIVKSDFRKSLPKILMLSFVIFIVFLFANSSNLNIRRLIGLYPILYVIYVLARHKMPNLISKSNKYAVFSYMCLCIIYIILKF